MLQATPIYKPCYFCQTGLSYLSVVKSKFSARRNIRKWQEWCCQTLGCLEIQILIDVDKPHLSSRLSMFALWNCLEFGFSKSDSCVANSKLRFSRPSPKLLFSAIRFPFRVDLPTGTCRTKNISQHIKLIMLIIPIVDGLIPDWSDCWCLNPTNLVKRK
jgi:hypothetical protein